MTEHLLALENSAADPPQIHVPPLSHCVSRWRFQFGIMELIMKRSRAARTSKATPDRQLDMFAEPAPSGAAARPLIYDQVPARTAQSGQAPGTTSLGANSTRPSRQEPIREFEADAVGLNPGALLDVRQAAAWLGLSKSTLDKMRCYGVGPRFIRATSRAIRYDPKDLHDFAYARRQATAELG
jgi:predicted DNA-binding transcriptional regulator AlpA